MIGGPLYCKPGGGVSGGLTLDDIVIEITPPALDFVVTLEETLDIPFSVTIPGDWDIDQNNTVLQLAVMSGTFEVGDFFVSPEWLTPNSGVIHIFCDNRPAVVDAVLLFEFLMEINQNGGNPYPVEGVNNWLRANAYKNSPSFTCRGEFQA